MFPVKMLSVKLALAGAALAVAFAGMSFAQQAPGAPAEKGKGKGGPKAARPGLFFKETLKDTPGGEHPVEQSSVASPNLELKVYSVEGPVHVTGSSTDENNPVHFWTGECEAGCGAAYRDKENFVDLSGLGRIRWTHKMSGFHQIRPIVKLADGTWLIGDRAEGTTTDWITTEFLFADVRWIKLDIKRMVTTGSWVEKPDLTKVDEVGWADLIPGSGHGQGGWSDIATIEVYGKPVKR